MGIISDAIRQRRVLAVTYDGEPRRVEPHCYGIDTKGHEALRAWQLNKGWRLFHVGKMLGTRMTEDTFRGPRPGYNPADKHMRTVYAAL